MITKKTIRRKLINLQNSFGKKRGKIAWTIWKKETGVEKKNG